MITSLLYTSNHRTLFQREGKEIPKKSVRELIIFFTYLNSQSIAPLYIFRIQKCKQINSTLPLWWRVLTYDVCSWVQKNTTQHWWFNLSIATLHITYQLWFIWVIYYSTIYSSHQIKVSQRVSPRTSVQKKRRSIMNLVW